MKETRRRFEDLAAALRLHAAARGLYRATIGRRGAKMSAKLRDFYSPLIRFGALVFDIGASIGKYAEALEAVGARVIALEPNAACVRHIELYCTHKKIEVIQAVAGPSNGLATLNVSDEIDELSSVSDHFMHVLQEQHPEFQGLWNRKIRVPMLTLDTLIEHYGMPAYVKIDVEGFEEYVLDGLSRQPQLLSFEFNFAYLDAAIRCLNKPIVSTGSVFNFVFEEHDRFELAEWTGRRDGFIRHLDKMEKLDRNGDVFVRMSV